MNVVLPLRAEPSPAALHMGQFCCAKGAGLRQLDKGGGSCKLRAADLCNGQKRGPWGGSASTRLLPWRLSHINSSGDCGCKRYISSVRKGSAQSKGSRSCPRKMATECWWIQSREVTLWVQTSGTYLGPNVMIRHDIMLAFRLACLTGMLRFFLFRGVKRFCCKPNKRRYCLRVEHKRLWKICQESVCAFLIPKHGRLKKKKKSIKRHPTIVF